MHVTDMFRLINYAMSCGDGANSVPYKNIVSIYRQEVKSKSAEGFSTIRF